MTVLDPKFGMLVTETRTPGGRVFFLLAPRGPDSMGGEQWAAIELHPILGHTDTLFLGHEAWREYLKEGEVK